MSLRETFASAYLEAAAFADWPEDAIALAYGEGVEETLREQARAFYDLHTNDIMAYPLSLEQAGHDLWFTRNGHGVGYWEEAGEAAERLDKAARALSTVDLYKGDDGLVYCG